MAHLPSHQLWDPAYGEKLEDFLRVSFNDDGTLRSAPVFLGYFNVKDYGAVGDGSHDDTIAIQAAISAAIAAGGFVYFPPGTYKTTSTLTISGHNVYFVGAGRTSTIAPTGNMTDGIKFVEASGCGMRDLQVSSGGGTISRLVHVTATASTENVLLENVTGIGTTGTSVIFGVGCDTVMDVSEIVFQTCQAKGGGLATNGWRVGNGSVGNVTNIRAYGCDSRDMASDGVVMAGAAMQWYGGTVSNNGGTTPGVWDFHVTANYTGKPLIIQGVRSENSTAFFSQDFPAGTYTSAPLIIGCNVTSFKATDKYVIVSNGKPAPTLIGFSAQNATNDPLIYSDITGIIAIDVTTNNPSTNGPWDPSGFAPQFATGTWTLDGSGTRSTRVGNNIRVEESNVVAFSATPVFDASKGSHQSVVLTGTVTSSSITNPQKAGQVITLEFVQDGTGSRAYAWPTTVRFAANTAPTATTTANRSDSVTFRWDGTRWREIARAVNVPVT